ncbi:MAG TPA: hypothetical protein VGR38_03665 [Candidatus Polarisedimenticolia bacterium]|jgi:hypothetical protein|nr:hypothetical protein [Candidatus Polarisedimenticolia bacterium]
MSRTRLVGIILFAGLFLPILTLAHSGGEAVTVSGEVVDLACFVAHAAKGPDHQKCALKCAQMGQPMGLLSADGKLYLLVADHTDPAPYNKARSMAADQVEIKGDVSEKSGMTILTVDEVKKR